MMQSKRTDQDPLHRASSTRLGQVDSMKRECDYTRRLLRPYVRGHVFAIQKSKVNRHLKTCVVCRSELEGIRRAEETRQILKDVNASEGIMHSVYGWLAAFGKLRTLLYRPLWVAGLVAIVAGTSYYGAVYFATMPRKLDQEIDRIVQTAPTNTVGASAPVSTATRTPSPSTAAAPTAVTAPAPVVAPTREPLVVTITPVNNTSALRRVNAAMRGNARFGKLRFSDTVREVTGSMRAEGLLAFFDRIEPSAKVRFNRKRLDSFPAGQAVPFVLKLKAAPQTAEKASVMPAQQPQPSQPATAPTVSGAQER